MSTLRLILCCYWVGCCNHHQVVVFISLGAGLVGVGLAFWKVRNLVMSEDEGGSIDAGTASFVNFTIRVVGAVMLLQVVLSVSLSLAFTFVVIPQP